MWRQTHQIVFTAVCVALCEASQLFFDALHTHGNTGPPGTSKSWEVTVKAISRAFWHEIEKFQRWLKDDLSPEAIM